MALHEEIWVDYFLTAGSIGNGTLLYDAHGGASSPTSTVKAYTAPTTAGDQDLVGRGPRTTAGA